MSKKTLKSKHTQHANNRLETRLHDTLTAYRSLLDIASSNKLLTESECTDRVNQFVALNEESRHIVMCCTYHFGAKTMPNVYAERWTAKAFSTSKSTGYPGILKADYQISLLNPKGMDVDDQKIGSTLGKIVAKLWLGEKRQFGWANDIAWATYDQGQNFVLFCLPKDEWVSALEAGDGCGSNFYTKEEFV